MARCTRRVQAIERLEQIPLIVPTDVLAPGSQLSDTRLGRARVMLRTTQSDVILASYDRDWPILLRARHSIVDHQSVRDRVLAYSTI